MCTKYTGEQYGVSQLQRFISMDSDFTLYSIDTSQLLSVFVLLISYAINVLGAN